jgi:transglutaminase-like putative cysteine protease
MRRRRIASNAEYLANVFLVCLASLGAIFSFTTAFKVPLHAVGIAIVAVFLALAFCFLFLRPHTTSLFYFLGIFILCGVVALFFIDEIYNTFLYSKHHILNTLCAQLQYKAPDIPASFFKDWAKELCNMVWMFVTLFVTFYFSFAICKKKSILLTLLGFVPFLGVPFFATLLPSLMPLMAILLCLTILLFAHLTRKQYRIGLARIVLTITPAVLLVMILLTSVIPANAYRRSTTVNELRDKIVFPIEGNYTEEDAKSDRMNLTPDLLEQSNLSALDDLSAASTKTVFRVYDSTHSNHYLKSYAGSVYTKTGWESLPKATYDALEAQLSSPLASFYLLPPQETVQLPLQEIEIFYRKSPDLLHVPYHLAEMESDENAYGALYDYATELHAKDVRHTYRYYDVTNLDPSIENSTLSEDQMLYQSFVHEHYLQIPDTLKTELDIILNQIAPDGTNAEEAILAFLRENYTYTTKPGATPEGADFVQYFLQENKKGYCAHFATTGTLLFRAAGIPARYAEGYVVRAVHYNEEHWATVPAKQAHAWVEIYDPLYGWIPVEVTPGAQTAETGEASIFERGLTASTNTPETSSAGSNNTSTGTPKNHPARPTASDTPTVQRKGFGFYNLLAVFALGILSIFILFEGWRLIARGIRYFRFRRKDHNENACVVYKYLSTFEPYGTFISREITRLSEKARFSQHALTDEEIKSVYHYAKVFPKIVYHRQTRRTKLYFRVKGML